MNTDTGVEIFLKKSRRVGTFGFKALLIVPVIAAAVLVAIDWWTTDRQVDMRYAYLLFHVVDAKTDTPIPRAMFTLTYPDRTWTVEPQLSGSDEPPLRGGGSSVIEPKSP